MVLFGRRLDVNEVLIVYGEGLIALASGIIRNIIKLEDDRYLVFVATNINFNIIKTHKSILETNVISYAIPINSNGVYSFCYGNLRDELL